MKLEAVDLENPQIIRVATITNIMGRMLQLFFDGQSKFQFVDFESPDIYPIGWCKRTGHTLHTPFGPSKLLFVIVLCQLITKYTFGNFSTFYDGRGRGDSKFPLELNWKKKNHMN